MGHEVSDEDLKQLLAQVPWLLMESVPETFIHFSLRDPVDLAGDEDPYNCACLLLFYRRTTTVRAKLSSRNSVASWALNWCATLPFSLSPTCVAQTDSD
jgi:hypothetical protein